MFDDRGRRRGRMDDGREAAADVDCRGSTDRVVTLLLCRHSEMIAAATAVVSSTITNTTVAPMKPFK